MNCDKPDRDCSKLKCGYPLPCPHHTAVIDIESGTVVINSSSQVSPVAVKRLQDILKTLRK